jgi:hypothetical protein
VPDEIERSIERFAALAEKIAADHERLADHFDPPPADIVGTEYIATKSGCTMVWVAKMVRDGRIPKTCIVPGSGDGKPWRFYRRRVDEWLSRR